MEVMILKKGITIPPKHLGKNIKNEISKEVIKRYTGYCSKNTGYIDKIIKVVSVIDNYTVNTSEDINFDVMFKAIVFKPQKGMVFECEISMIFIHGIFAKQKNMKILVPASNLKDFEFIIGENKFKSKKVEITMENKIKVIIEDIKYDKGNYSCIGNLKSVLKKKEV